MNALLAPRRTQEDIFRSLMEPFDPEREAHAAGRKRYEMDPKTGLVVPIRSVGGASFLSGIPMETFYSNATIGVSKTFGSTGESVLNDVASMGQSASLPPYFWAPTGAIGKAFRVVARGVYSTTSAPTFTWTTRLGAIASTSASIVGISGAIVAGSTLSNIMWEQELDVQLSLYGTTAGANSTVRGLGLVQLGLTAVTLTGGTMTGGSAGSATGTVATVDISVINYLSINGNCGSASASNILQLLQLFVLGLN